MGVDPRSRELGFEAMDGGVITDEDFVVRVRDALTSVDKGDVDHYNELVAVLHHRESFSSDNVAALETSLKGLSGAVMYIDSFLHQSLLTSVFTMSMWNHNPYVMNALIKLIISLAASSGKYVDLCLEMLVGNFTPPPFFIPLLSQPRGISKKSEVLPRIRSAFKDIADLIPLSPLRLNAIVIQKKPNFRVQEKVLMLYVENMLKLEGGDLGDLVRGTMLSGVVDLLLELDTEIAWDDILQDDNTKGLFNMELEDIEEFSDDDETDVIELPREISRKNLGGNSYAEKLDSLMVLVFEHLESCKDGGRIVQVFEYLLRSFQNAVLTAYKSKFTQFVMFFACTLDPENCGTRFATMLADIFVSDTCTPIERMSAAAYLASYLSRGQFLPTSLVTDILKRLVEWCSLYCTIHNDEIEPKAHRVFYSGCQAIMYVLCFRMRSILTDPWFKPQLFVLPLDKILTHKLSPMKVCLPSIVNEFLQQAKAAHLFSASEKFLFDDYLESELSKAFGGTERLDMFFPFDPCLLKKSERFIRPNFIFWSLVKPTYDDDEEALSDEEADEVFVNGNTMDHENPRSLEDRDFDDFDSALNRMSITPRDSMKYHSQMPSRIRPSTSPESL